MKNLFRGLRFSWAGLLLFLCMVVLLAIGVASINSACAVREGPVRWLHRQQLRQWIPIGMAFYLFFALVPHRRLADFSALPYLAAVLLLVLVLVPGIGTVKFHARRWLFGFQPSEFAKLAVLLATAFLLTTDVLERPGARLAALALATAAPVLLIARQPDLGSALVIVPVVASMLFVSGAAPRFLLVSTILVVVVATLFLGAILLPETMPEGSPRRARIERVADKLVFPH